MGVHAFTTAVRSAGYSSRVESSVATREGLASLVVSVHSTAGEIAKGHFDDGQLRHLEVLACDHPSIWGGQFVYLDASMPIAEPLLFHPGDGTNWDREAALTALGVSSVDRPMPWRIVTADIYTFGSVAQMWACRVILRTGGVLTSGRHSVKIDDATAFVQVLRTNEGTLGTIGAVTAPLLGDFLISPLHGPVVGDPERFLSRECIDVERLEEARAIYLEMKAEIAQKAKGFADIKIGRQ
jgi:hypothetical protein